MIGRILKRDLTRNYIINLTLCGFIIFAAFLVASGAGIIIELIESMDNLFEKSKASHFIQMHSGEINQSKIDTFTTENKLVKKQQTVEMLNINGANIYLNSEVSEEKSLMDISFVKQNKEFDYLLDLENEIIEVRDGEIAIPIYFMQQRNLEIGDTVEIAGENFKMKFVIKSFVRDAQMNTSFVTSKRFVISDKDWEKLKLNIGESEYLIEFQLNDMNKVNEFESLYQEANLPNNGSAITYILYRTLNGLSDGVVAAMFVLIGILLIIIALLCLRYIILATMEEDYREIGIMKGIGIHSRNISKIYMIKYVFMAGCSCLVGYFLSLFVGGIFTKNISLYMGVGKKTVLSYIPTLFSVLMVFIVIVFFCSFILKRLQRISAIEAIGNGSFSEGRQRRRDLKISNSSFHNLNIFLGIKEVFQRFKFYGVLCIVFIISSFIAIVPVNFLNTVKSPSFITYMGAGQSDLRIDLQRTENIEQRYKDMTSYIKNDTDIEEYAVFVTSVFQVLNPDGTKTRLKVESGDFSIFPLEYLEGYAPKYKNEIALSSMNANEMELSVGDTLILIIDNKERILQVCGIYQDITNGGKTAKATFPYNKENVLWYVINLDLKPSVDVYKKSIEYSEAFYPAKILDMEKYLSQTMGTLIKQLELSAIVALVTAIGIVILITSMFFKMMIVKESSQIAILKSIGFSPNNIRVQYITRSILIFGIGIVIGTFGVARWGESLASWLMSFMGASDINLVVDPFISYILFPLILIMVVVVTTWISSLALNKTSERELLTE